MNRIEIKSKAIKSMGYDPVAYILELEMHSGDVYQYKQVPPEIYADFEKSDSKGKLFPLIKRSFPCECVHRVPREPGDEEPEFHYTVELIDSESLRWLVRRFAKDETCTEAKVTGMFDLEQEAIDAAIKKGEWT